MIKKHLIRKILAVTATLMLSAHTMAADFTIKLSHSSPATNDRLQKSLLVFKQNVEKRTNGHVAVKLFPASQLGGEREQLEGVQFGSIEMAVLVGETHWLGGQAHWCRRLT